MHYSIYKIYCQTKQHTHTHTHNRLTTVCPGPLGWTGTRRNVHPLTAILNIPDHQTSCIHFLHLPPTIHSILLVQCTCLTVLFHNLSSGPTRNTYISVVVIHFHITACTCTVSKKLTGTSFWNISVLDSDWAFINRSVKNWSIKTMTRYFNKISTQTTVSIISSFTTFSPCVANIVKCPWSNFLIYDTLILTIFYFALHCNNNNHNNQSQFYGHYTGQPALASTSS